MRHNDCFSRYAGQQDKVVFSNTRRRVSRKRWARDVLLNGTDRHIPKKVGAVPIEKVDIEKCYSCLR